MAPVRRLLPVLAFAASLAAAAPATAAPLPGQPGGFGITPARRIVVGQPGIDLTPTTVTNTTTATYRVSVFPAILHQDLTGAYDFAATPLSLNNSKLVLSASPGSFTLAPGQQLGVHLHWNLLPRNQPWVAIGVVFQGVPGGQSGSVRVITRLLSVNLLRLPGATRVDGEFTGLYPQQFGARQLNIVARVKNTGDTFASPSDGQLTITDSGGRVVFAEPWAGRTLIPDAQVDFPIIVKKVLPAGSYTATVTMGFGGPRRISAAFTLVGPNRLPTPAIAIEQFNATGVVGAPARVTAKILSTGTAPASVALHLYLATVSEQPGQRALATGEASYRNLAPGTVARLSRPLGGHLRKGSYRVIATWVDATGAQHTTEANFTTTVGQSFLQSVWSFIKDHVILWVLLLLLAVLALAAVLVRRLMDRQRQIEAELALTRARLHEPELSGRASPDSLAAPMRGRATATRSLWPRRRLVSNGSARRRNGTATNGTAEAQTARRLVARELRVYLAALDLVLGKHLSWDDVAGQLRNDSQWQTYSRRLARDLDSGAWDAAERAYAGRRLIADALAALSADHDQPDIEIAADVRRDVKAALDQLEGETRPEHVGA